MNKKKDVQFSFDECLCAEMMTRMMTQAQKFTNDACTELMAQFVGSRGDGECLEMISQMMSVCCGAEQESDEKVRKA